MDRIESTIDTSSKEFKENHAHYEKMVKSLKEEIEKAQKGGGEEKIQLHKSRNKMLARERIDALLDPDTPFIEFNPLAAHGMYGDKAPCAGIVTGIGIIHGREVVIVANDATVTGGTYYPMTVKKHLRAQEIALENNLPCIYLVDSGGAFLPMQDEVFPDREHFGRIFFNRGSHVINEYSSNFSSYGIMYCRRCLCSCHE